MQGRSKTPTYLLVASDVEGLGGIQQYCRWVRASLERLGQTEVVDLSLDGTGRARIRAFVRGAMAIARRRPTAVVIAHASYWPLVVLCRVLRVPCSVVAYGWEVWGDGNRGRTASLRLASRVWPISTFTGERVADLHRVPAARIGEPLGGAIEERFFAVTPRRVDGPHRLLLVGRMENTSYKGFDVSIAATERLAGRFDVQLRIVGGGPDADAVAAMAANSPADVVCLGRIDDDALRDEYATAAVLLLPSRHAEGARPTGEGLGITLLEAGAAGVPGVASWIGGSTDCVVDGDTGFLVDPTSAVAVADAVAAVIDAGTGEMGEAARAFVRRRHSFDAFATRVAGEIGRLDRRSS